MNPKLIRNIDSWVGQPICFLLTLFRWFVRPITWPHDVNRPAQKILLIKMIEQGATVAAYKSIQRAVELVGRENVYFWVFKENRFILDLLELVPRENVLVIRNKKPHTLFIDLLKTTLQARRLKIDATVDMEFFSRASAILAYLSGARIRVGLDRFSGEGPYRGDLLTHRVQHNPFLHVSVAYYLMVDAVNADPSSVPLLKVEVPTIDFRPPRFKPAAAETLKVRQILDSLAGHPVTGPIVLLNANAGDLLPLRRWPSENFVALGRRILESNPHVTLVLTGGPNEAEGARALAAAISASAICTAGHTTLRELIVLYTLADVLVTNDSGPGHFSTLTDISAIVLFGPETPAVFGPIGDYSEVIRRDLACSPCVNVYNHRFSPCNDPVCMKTITVDQVYDRVERRLAEKLDGAKQLQLTVLPANARQVSGAAV